MPPSHTSSYPLVLMLLSASATAGAALPDQSTENTEKTAAMESGDLQLDTIVVSATRTPHTLASLPASISVVTHDDMQAKQAASIGAVLNTVPGLNIGGGARAAAEMPSIRGYSGKQITLLVDGARNNDAGGLSAPLMINPAFLAQVDVLRGATSSLYGSGGLGGAIAFRTLSAADLLQPGQTAGGDVSSTFASADVSANTNLRVYAKNAQVDGLLALGYRDWGRIRLGGGDFLRPNDGHAGSGLVKLGWNAGERLRLQLAHLFYDEQNFRPNNPQANSLFPYLQKNRVKQQQTTLSASLTDARGDPAIDVSLYRSKLKRSADQTAAPPQNATASVTQTTGFSVQRSDRLSSEYWGQHRFTYGLDYYQDRQSASDGGKPNGALPNGSQAVYGLFLQDEITLAKHWQLSSALRADRFHTSPDSSADRSVSSSRISPKMTLAWQTRPWFNLYASYGESFRAPSISEAYQQLSGNTYFSNFARNPGLQPEIAKTVELGANFNARRLFNNADRLRSRIAIFQSNAHNLIASTVIGSYRHPVLGPRPVIQYQNIGRARRYGVELENSYISGALELGLNFSHIRVVDRDTGSKLFSPPDKLTLQAGYRFADNDDLAAIWNTTAVAAQDYDATLLRRRSGYAVHSVYLTWAPLQQPWRMDIGLENLFDKRYSSYQAANVFSDVNETGRNLKMTLSAAF